MLSSQTKDCEALSHEIISKTSVLINSGQMDKEEMILIPMKKNKRSLG